MDEEPPTPFLGVVPGGGHAKEVVPGGATRIEVPPSSWIELCCGGMIARWRRRRCYAEDRKNLKDHRFDISTTVRAEEGCAPTNPNTSPLSVGNEPELKENHVKELEPVARSDSYDFKERCFFIKALEDQADGNPGNPIVSRNSFNGEKDFYLSVMPGYSP